MTLFSNDYCGFRHGVSAKLEPVRDNDGTILGFVKPTADGLGAYLAFDHLRFMVGGRHDSKQAAVNAVKLWNRGKR